MAFARVSTYEFPADRLDEATPAFEEATTNLRGMEGITEALFLVDRNEGKAITITLWESEEALRATEEQANQMRQQTAGSAGMTISSVEPYEVALEFGPRR